MLSHISLALIILDYQNSLVLLWNPSLLCQELPEYCGQVQSLQGVPCDLLQSPSSLLQGPLALLLLPQSLQLGERRIGMRRTGAVSCYWCRNWLNWAIWKTRQNIKHHPPLLAPLNWKKEISDSELWLDPFAKDVSCKFLLFPGLLVLEDLLYFSLGIRLT